MFLELVAKIYVLNTTSYHVKLKINLKSNKNFQKVLKNLQKIELINKV